MASRGARRGNHLFTREAILIRQKKCGTESSNLAGSCGKLQPAGGRKVLSAVAKIDIRPNGLGGAPLELALLFLSIHE